MSRPAHLHLLLAVVALFGAGCLENSAVVCADGKVCARNMACDEVHQGCVLPQQVQVCEGREQNATCRYSGTPDGRCYEGVCLRAGCGNGRLDAGEVCDDGNRLHGDGCSGDCASDERCGNHILDPSVGEACEPKSENDPWCRDTCQTVRCGDGKLDLDALERCDDGERNDAEKPDACRPNCQLPRCGDKVTDSGEKCDDGNQKDKDGCSGDCRSNETCGNGVVDAEEECELVDGAPTRWCRSNCTSVRCGDGIPDMPYEACDEGEHNSEAPNAACRPDCQPPRCGDGIHDLGEVCDDGNRRDGDGCSYDCQSIETCGNGYVDRDNGEACDDGNALSHDGCSSNCFEERPLWRSVLEGYERYYPEVFADRAVAFDAARNRLVLYDAPLTWEFERSNWRSARTTTLPPAAKIRYGLAWDAHHMRTVLFGGLDARDTTLGETWTWDGARWEAMTPDTPSPSARVSPAMAYDAARKRIVLFGGVYWDHVLHEDHLLDDTWEWDGSRWHAISTKSAPPAGYHKMTYDPKRGAVVLLDGHDLWYYGGSSWERVAVSEPLPNLRKATLYFDRQSERLALAAMLSDSSRPSDHLNTWTWDGSAFVDHRQFGVMPGPGTSYGNVYPIPSTGRFVVGDYSGVWLSDGDGFEYTAKRGLGLPKVTGHGMAYDALRGVVVMVDGSAGPEALPPYGDLAYATWEWDGDAWTKHLPIPSPEPAYYPSLVFSGSSGVLMLGPSEDGVNDLWAWDGKAWQREGASPAASRWEPAMAYDSAHDRVVLFGGFHADANSVDYLDDTWVRESGAWRQLPLEASPPGRHKHAMTFDAAREHIVMWGGCVDRSPGCGPDDDSAWELTDDGWQERATGAGPASASPALAYDPPRRQSMAMMCLPDPISSIEVDYASTHLWSWPRTPGADAELAWREDSMREPMPRFNAGLVYDALRRRMIAVTEGLLEPSYTWEFAYLADEVDEVCTEGFDVDHDGLVGCDDPDCWGHCTPLAPPGAAFRAGQPHCGDGVCNAALETCRMCPGDCACEPVCGDFFCDSGETVEGCPGDCAALP